MAGSANAIARGAVTAAGLILLAIVTPAGLVAQPALVADAPPVAPIPAIVAGGGVTLRSVRTNFPRSDSTFPGGAKANAINNDCLICRRAAVMPMSLSRGATVKLPSIARNQPGAPGDPQYEPARGSNRLPGRERAAIQAATTGDRFVALPPGSRAMKPNARSGNWKRSAAPRSDARVFHGRRALDARPL